MVVLENAGVLQGLPIKPLHMYCNCIESFVYLFEKIYDLS